MRNLILLIGLVVFAAPAFAQKGEVGDNEAILRKLDEIQKTQEEIAERLIRIEAKLANAPQAEGSTIFQGRGADEEALSKITLPDNPTKDQVRKYVQDIAKASRNQNSWSSIDPQVEMLERVGPANLDVLLEALGSRGGEGLFVTYLMPAIKALARDEHKEMILKLLPQRHELAEIVWEKGWAEDARSTLIDGLRAKPEYLPIEWVKAVASFKDPATYDSLKWDLANGGNPWWTYEAIKNLPGLDLSKEAAEMWARFKDRDNLFEVVPAACVAVEFGHLDALMKLMDVMENPDPHNHYVTEAQKAVRRVTDVRGSKADIAIWFRQNKDKLVFDAKEKKFIVKNAESAAPAAGTGKPAE